jgi:Ca-activated chloride channel family protein
VEAEYNRIRVKKPVTIAGGQAATVTLPLNAGRLKIAIKDTNTLQPAPTTSYLVAIEPVIDGKPRADQSVLLHSGSVTEVPVGTYNVSLSDGPVRQSKTVALTAGTETTLDFTSATGRVELSAGLREDGGAIDDVTFTISEDDPDSPDGRREIARSRAPTPSFTLPAGTYYASAHSGDGDVRQRIAVGAGDVVKRALILPLVPVKISALIGGQLATDGQGIAYRVTEPGDRGTRALRQPARAAAGPLAYPHLDAHHLKAAGEISGRRPKPQRGAEVQPAKSTSPALHRRKRERHLWKSWTRAQGCLAHGGVDARLLAPGRYTYGSNAASSTEAAFGFARANGCGDWPN